MYNCTSNIYKKLWAFNGASPVARWPRIHLSMQEMYRRPGFNPWVRKIPWRKKWQPTLVFLPGESQGQMSLHGVAKSQTQLSTHNTRTWTFNIYDLMSLDHFLFSMAHGPSPSTEQQKTYGKKKIPSPGNSSECGYFLLSRTGQSFLIKLAFDHHGAPSNLQPHQSCTCWCTITPSTPCPKFTRLSFSPRKDSDRKSPRVSANGTSRSSSSLVSISQSH